MVEDEVDEPQHLTLLPLSYCPLHGITQVRIVFFFMEDTMKLIGIARLPGQQ